MTPGPPGAASEGELDATLPGPTRPRASVDPHDVTGTSGERNTAASDGPGLDIDAELARAHRDGAMFGAASPRVGKYVILGHLGRGGMGSVYAVYNPDLDRKSVIKLVRPDRSGPDTRARLLQEARLTATVSHPNVVQIYDSGEHRDEVYVVMEFIAGVDLDHWRREGPHPWPQVLAVYRQAGLGLAAAHARGIVHRDFTPRNAMLGDDERVRVLDFGLAHARRSVAAESTSTGAPPGVDGLTAEGAIVGTPRYMSPEQIRGVETDARSDQFSFCVALWEALLGHLPFVGADLFEYNDAVVRGAVDPPEDLRGVPRRVLRALRRGLAPGPAARFPDMHALLAALAVTPARPLRIVAAIAGAAAIVGGVIASRPAATATPAELCAPAIADELAAVWSEPRAAALRTAIAAVDAGAAERTVARLDGFAARWLARRRDLCAAGLAGVLAPAQQRRGLQCLAGHRALLGELVARLTGGAADIDRGLAELPEGARVDACADPLHLAGGAGVAPTSARDGLTRVEGALARAEAALILGDYAGSEGTAAHAVARARALEHGPTLAAALYQLGRAQSYGPRAGEAAATLREAADLAEREDLHDLAADVALRRIRVARTHGARPADAHVWFEVLGFKLDRLGEARGPRRAEALETLGSLALDGRDGAAARDLFERAAAADDDASPLRRALLELGLGRVDRMAGAHAAAVVHLERALALSEAELGPAHPKLVFVLINLAEAQYELERVDAAAATIDRALALVAGRADAFAGQVYVDAARIAAARGEPAAAGAWASRARVALRDPALPLDVRSYRPLAVDIAGTTAFAGGDAAAAISGYLELLAAPEGRLAAQSGLLLDAYRNAANIARVREQPALALRFIAAARRVAADPAAQTLAPDDPVLAQLAVAEGEALLALGRRAEAVQVGERGLEGWDPAGERGDAAAADLHALLFEALRDRDRDRARSHASAALAHFAVHEPPPREYSGALAAWLRRNPGDYPGDPGTKGPDDGNQQKDRR